MVRPASAASGSRLRLLRQGEDARREQIAGVEIDEAAGELVDHGRAGVDMRDLERGAGEPDHQRRDAQAVRELGGDEEDRQQVDEPERAERLPEGFDIEPERAERAVLVDEHRRLERELDRGPQQIEIDEMHDLAVEIGAPVAVDDLGQEQPGNQKEVRHPERLGEGDHGMQPALLADGVPDAQRRMHHHHEDDAEALGVIDPVDPLSTRCAIGGHDASHFGSHLSRIRMNVLPSALPIQRRCQGQD